MYLNPERAGWYYVTVSRPKSDNPSFKGYVMKYNDWFYYNGKQWDLQSVEPFNTVIEVIKPE